MRLKFKAVSENETFARVCTAAFLLPLDPKVNDMTDIKTAVSEAVTNAVIHGYETCNGDEAVELYCAYEQGTVYIEVSDKGCGIENIALAKKPLYTSKPELERSGMGFTVMEAFMDEVEVISEIGIGTTVKMKKSLKV
jgi:stage II sporulation protein AB (anti-sigma F factor)